MATRRSKKKRPDQYDVRDPEKSPAHGDRYWEDFGEGFEYLIGQVLAREGQAPRRSPKNALGEIFSILDTYTLWGAMTSSDAPAASPMLDLGGHMSDCPTALAHPETVELNELCLKFFVLGWKAQVAFKARAWWKLKEQTQLASAEGAKKARDTAAEHKELMESRAVPIALKNPRWSIARIAKQIVEDAKTSGPRWLAERRVTKRGNRVERAIGPVVTEARARFRKGKRSPRTDGP